MGMFAETVKSHNDYVETKYREASKMNIDSEDFDLAEDFADVNAA